MDAFTTASLLAFLQVLFIDVVLAGDNALVVGVAAAGLPSDLRRKAILAGLGAAVVLRIGLALIATQLLNIVGLSLAGGILLLWVCWKLYRELVASKRGQSAAAEDAAVPSKRFGSALTQIVLADLSMSLDNVLAVSGAAAEHPWVLAVGLIASVALMGVAASFIATALQRYRWIAWVGIAVILAVAVRMIWTGGAEIHEVVT